MTPDICECGHKRQKHKWDMFANPQECLKDGCPCKKFTPQNTHQSPPYLKGEEIADKKPSDNSDYISSDVGLKTSGDFSNSNAEIINRKCKHIHIGGREVADNKMERFCAECGKILGYVPIKSSGFVI